MENNGNVDKDINVPIKYMLYGKVYVNTRCVLCNREYNVPEEFADNYICLDCADLYTR